MTSTALPWRISRQESHMLQEALAYGRSLLNPMVVAAWSGAEGEDARGYGQYC